MNYIEILQQPESRMLEFKSKLPSNRQSLLKTIVAFANGSGGSIYIGVRDDRTVCGIKEEPFDFEEKLSSIIYDSISPIPNVFYQTITVEGEIIFLIKVLPGANKPYYFKQLGPEEGTYVRIGSTNRKADVSILTELRRQSRNISFDIEVDTSFECDIVDMNIVGTFLSWRGLDIKPSVNFLVKNRLAQRYNHTCHPTVGGILLFSSSLPESYEYAGFRVTRYQGESRADLIHSSSFASGLLLLPEKVMEFVRLYLVKTIKITGLKRKETYPIPISALREAVVNAICHRDYSIAGAYNKLDIFSDRVEIMSPGVLPMGITLQDLGQGTSEIRNRAIVKIFRQSGFIEQLGTGIIRMREACRKRGLPEPKFEEVGNFFKVTLFSPKEELSEELQELFHLLEDHGPLSSREIAERLDIHQNTALKRVRKLEEKKLLSKKGRGPRVKYFV